MRRHLAEQVGQFDERLGLGSGTPTGSGEEIDYLLRALDTDAWIDYDPTLVVWHAVPEQDAARLRALGTRDGRSVGYLLRKHGFGTRTLLRMIARPAGGALLALARRDPAGARYHAATLLGRLRGYGRDGQRDDGRAGGVRAD